MNELYKIQRIVNDEVIDDIDITKYEFIQALNMHRRLKQRKEL